MMADHSDRRPTAAAEPAADASHDAEAEPQIRIRACLAVVHGSRILLVPHYVGDGAEVHWLLPGGRVHFGEPLEQAALREFLEETGLQGRCSGLLDVSEAPLPGPPGHIVTITFGGIITGGRLTPEHHPVYGTKLARWFSHDELRALPHHPPDTVAKAFQRLTAEDAE